MRIDKAIVQQERAKGKMCFKCDHCSRIVFVLVAIGYALFKYHQWRITALYFGR
jgi:hypothetical protein